VSVLRVERVVPVGGPYNVFFLSINIVQVLAMVLRHLSATGVALIASKRFYFGVGGGTYTLESLVQANGLLNYEMIQVYQDGASNIREIVRLTRK